MNKLVPIQNLGYGIGVTGLAASAVMAIAGSPALLNVTTFGISSGILGSTAVTGIRVSRYQDSLKTEQSQAIFEAENRHDRRISELEAQLETSKTSYQETLEKAQQYKAKAEHEKNTAHSLETRAERLQATFTATSRSLETLQAAYATLEQQHRTLTEVADREWEQKEALEKQISELQLKLNRSQQDIDRDVELLAIKAIEPKVQQAVTHALESKINELSDAHADIEKLLDRLQESNDIIEDTRDNAIPAIRGIFDGQLNSVDSQLMQLAGENDQLKQQVQVLQSPKPFPGETVIDRAGNRIIEHFFKYSVVLDALESISTPTGFRLRFKCDRNSSATKLTAEEFDKRTTEAGLMGLSYAPLTFSMDTRNLIVSVEIVTVAGAMPPSIASNKALTTTITTELGSSGAAPESAFRSLNCFPACDFEAVIREKFVPRVRVVAGSTGGKSPLLELIACGIAQTQGGQLWLINPIPGSEKDWFHLPGVIAPGSDGIQGAIEWIKSAHAEFKRRRNDLPGTASKPFITVVVDEINAIAREYADLGAVIKDFYQLSDHTRMGFSTAGQGANVSGVSGGVSKKATGNATKLMEEDFQNSTQVFTAQAAALWLKKHKPDLQPTLKQLEALCQQLNEAEGLSPRPKPGTKVADRQAYRVALVTSPAAEEPFFIQIPPYSSYAHQLNGVSFPQGAKVTAPLANQIALGLIEASKACPHCGSSHLKVSKNRGERKQYRCTDCGRYHTV